MVETYTARSGKVFYRVHKGGKIYASDNKESAKAFDRGESVEIKYGSPWNFILGKSENPSQENITNSSSNGSPDLVKEIEASLHDAQKNLTEASFKLEVLKENLRDATPVS